MPRADHEMILRVFAETQNKSEVARRLGYAYETVVQAINQAKGLCACGSPLCEASKRYCQRCLEMHRRATARRRDKLFVTAVCLNCGAERDNGGSNLCAACREKRRVIVARYKLTHREEIRGRRFGGVWGLVMERDSWTCQVCGEAGRELHHRDGDRRNNVPENLIALCHSCHLTLTRLLAHPKRAALLALIPD